MRLSTPLDPAQHLLITTPLLLLYDGDMRRIQLVSDLTTDELEARYRRAHEPTERRWWQILWLLSRDQTAKLVTESTGYSRYWIGQIAKRYNAEGPAGMVNRQHTRERRTLLLLLSSAHLEELHQALSGPAPEASAGRAEQWRRGWPYAWDARSRRNGTGTTCSASARACASHVHGMSPPAPRSRRLIKNGPSAESRGGDRLSRGPGRGLGDG